MTLRIILFILIVLPKVIFCQTTTIHGKVSNEKNQPLEYVSIGIIDKTIGTISNKNGLFSLQIQKNQLNDNDSLRFSMIGYSAKTFSIIELQKTIESGKPIHVYLSEKVEQLDEVVISTNRLESKEVGTVKKSVRLGAVNFSIFDIPNQNLGSEIGRKFKIDHENTLLTKFHFCLYQNEFDTVKFRINAYSLKRLKPHKNLLKENIFIEITDKKNGWFEIDLLPYEILVSDDIVVSIEWVSKSEKGDKLSIPITLPVASAHFYKYGSQNRWKRFDTMSSLMNLEVKF